METHNNIKIMTEKKQLNLPRVYKAKDKKFEKHNGKPKLSYSQYTSYIDPQYNTGYILGYIFGLGQDSNFWAGFGTYCGTSIEYRMDPGKAQGKDAVTLKEAFSYFNEKDIETLGKADKMFPDNTVYEREIVLDRGHYVTQGFIDVNYSKDKKEDVIDVKTGGKSSKTKGTSFYGSDKYGQTRLYARALEEEGEEIGYCGVVFLDRTYEGTFEDPILHLSGDIIQVTTPYTKKETDALLVKMDKVAEEISSLKTTYDLLKDLTIKM